MIKARITENGTLNVMRGGVLQKVICVHRKQTGLTHCCDACVAFHGLASRTKDERYGPGFYSEFYLRLCQEARTIELGSDKKALEDLRDYTKPGMKDL